ncbi:hypothetical protein S245_060751 [Arachis hypogaea]|nr:uncharacterized protein DS421_17g593000 [Arachis hypogaea]
MDMSGTWVPEAEVRWKCLQEEKLVGFGCVLRVETGNWIHDSSGKVDGVSVMRAGIWTILCELLMALEIGANRVICEIDSMYTFFLVNHYCYLEDHGERNLLQRIFELKYSPN